jgi:GNAT superfamily N-acetyltransferase
MVEIKVFTGKEAATAASLAIEHHLFVSEHGWELCDRLRWVESLCSGGTIALAFDGNKPIGVGLIRHHADDYATYVKPDHRRKKIGSQMLQKLREDGFFVNQCVGTGAVGSNAFWRVNEVRRFEMYSETDEETGCFIDG